jgi:uncharacterized lipoprotein YddW (UPF0748 family)
MELSAAVFADYPGCSERQGQDWVKWAQDNLVDYLFPMNYTNSLRTAVARALCHMALVRDSVPVWEGLGKSSSASQLSTDDLSNQVRATLQAGASGIVLFQYPSITDEDIEMLQNL